MYINSTEEVLEHKNKVYHKNYVTIVDNKAVLKKSLIEGSFKITIEENSSAVVNFPW